MTRQLIDESLGTEYSKWIRTNLRDSSDGLCVTNLDFIIEDFRNRRFMLLEEKRFMAELNHGQRKTFMLIDTIIKQYMLLKKKDHPMSLPYDYWGFYLLQLPESVPSLGMLLNGQEITEGELIDHLNFVRQVVPPL